MIDTVWQRDESDLSPALRAALVSMRNSYRSEGERLSMASRLPPHTSQPKVQDK